MNDKVNGQDKRKEHIGTYVCVCVCVYIYEFITNWLPYFIQGFKDVDGRSILILVHSIFGDNVHFCSGTCFSCT